jgi:hypothetical protein
VGFIPTAVIGCVVGILGFGTFSEWPFLGQKVVDSSGDLSEAVCETRKRNAIN